MCLAGYARLLVALIAAFAGAAFAQQTFTYPEKGQSPQQQEFDKGQCYSWAVQQSNFDPLNPPPPSMPRNRNSGGNLR